ncbi:hypothetical protein P3S68_003762 [Capsicum galapagoense]
MFFHLRSLPSFSYLITKLLLHLRMLLLSLTLMLANRLMTSSMLQSPRQMRHVQITSCGPWEKTFDTNMLNLGLRKWINRFTMSTRKNDCVNDSGLNDFGQLGVSNDRDNIISLLRLTEPSFPLCCPKDDAS